MHQKLLIIANENAGMVTTSLQQVEDVLNDLQQPYELKKVTNPHMAAKLVRDSRKSYDAIAVYGGDGTVTSVVRAAAKKRIPVMILPGGTENALAKAVGSPLDLTLLAQRLASGDYTIRHIPITTLNGKPLFLDIHFGWFAQSLSTTPRGLKRWLGSAAYFLNAVKIKATLGSQIYDMTIDGQRMRLRGVSCMVATLSNPHLMGIRLFNRPHDGVLRVAVVRSRGAFRLLAWYFARIIFNHNIQGTIFIKEADRVIIHDGPTEMVADDQLTTAKFPLDFRISDNHALIAVPKISQSFWKPLWMKIMVTYYRAFDQSRRVLTGTPSLQYSKVARNLYLGGQYRKNTLPLFMKWKITGIVSMRMYKPEFLSDQVEILHLPTIDMTAPKLKDLQKGAEFIDRHIKKGGAVYVHCRLGEGRGPTMAAAYLISRGMRPQDAISHLQRYRPFARPNKKQVEQLVRLSSLYTKSKV